MKIGKFVQSLLPRIEKKNVKANLEDLRVELRDHTLPPYSNAIAIFKGWKYKDSFTQEIDKRFAKEVSTRFRGDYIEKTYEILNRTMENIATLEKLVDKHYSNDIMRTAMSFSDVQLLQLIESVHFATKYARKLLIYTLSVETDLYRQNKMVGLELTTAEIKWLQGNYGIFFLTMNALDHTPKEYDKVFAQIPDITVEPDNVDNVATATGLKNLDPLKIGAYGLVLNPIYHIRLVYTEWQVARYDAAKEEHKLLEYQILDMKNALEGKSDPKLERALEYTQDRMSRLNYKIEKMTAEAA